jgi:hypothetical protein
VDDVGCVNFLPRTPRTPRTFSTDLVDVRIGSCGSWLISFCKEKRGLKKINCLLNKNLYILFLVILYFFIGCNVDDTNYLNSTNKTVKIYSGSYGYNIAYRVVDNKVYSGSYGYEVAYRIENNKIYSGSYGYDVAYRVDGNKIYSGSYGYDVAFRVEGNKIYSGSYGYDVVFRIER